ncbi:MAG: hypothetical protein DRP54_06325 [Spirochaetes bacterium]|nr:MAG: hypothetical protein DRP54_06325 [Spirochaetota bacterium]
MGKVVIFEDKGYENLLPLTHTRAVFELRCGIMLLYQKLIYLYQDLNLEKDFYYFCREYLKDSLSEKGFLNVNQSLIDSSDSGTTGENVLFVNGRALIEKEIKIEGPEEVGVDEEDVIYIRTTKTNAQKITNELLLQEKPAEKIKKLGFKIVPFKTNLIKYPWELIHHNSDEIIRDFKLQGITGTIEGKVYEGAHLLNPRNIFIGRGSYVKPGSVLDAEDGPIYIGEKVKIMPNSAIQGPAYIGDGSSIKMGAKIYEGTSIGEVCKVGGEVEETIIHSYSNKQHDGFLGHAYLGMWCNLGAGTSNSDLKNNYGNVKVYVRGKLIDTGSIFVGLTMGDHSKSGINTMFNTGTVVGVMANVFGEGFPPKYIPSFAWGGREGFQTYDLEKALEVARRVMARRDKELTSAQEKLLRKIFELTEDERKW